MNPVRVVSGRVAVLDRPDVDTDQIIPKQFLKRIERTGYGPFAFFDWRYDEDGEERPEFELNRPQFDGACVLLAGRNFGCGSSREHAAWALSDYGFGAIVAPSFGDIFRTNAGKNGLLAIVLPPDEVDRLMESVDLDTGSELTVDLERRVVVGPDGREVSIRVRRGHEAPPAERSRRHRADAPARGRDRGIRDRTRDRVTVAVLPGDGIGPEVAAEAIRVLDALGIEHAEHSFGGGAILSAGTPLPDETLAACRESDAVLLAAVGLPELEGKPLRPEQGLLGLRKELGVYANLRPARAPGIDLIVVRELVSGLYFGAKGTRDDGTWFDTCEYTRPEVERVAHRAFALARERKGRVTSVDKVNVMHTSRLWRDVVTELGAAEYPDVPLDHALVDSFAMTIVNAPESIDVVLTENTFGDILSDVAAAVTGGLGLAASASLGDEGPGLFEPVHGSAPQIAGQGIANPAGMLRSTALLLRHGLGLEDEAVALERAVDGALRAAPTLDLGGSSATREMGDAVLRRLAV